MEVAARYEDAGKVNFKASVNAAVVRHRRCGRVLAASGAANPRKDGTQIVDKNELINLRKRRRRVRRAVEVLAGGEEGNSGRGVNRSRLSEEVNTERG